MTDKQYQSAAEQYRAWEQASRAAILSRYVESGKLPEGATWDDAEELLVAEMEER